MKRLCEMEYGGDYKATTVNVNPILKEDTKTGKLECAYVGVWIDGPSGKMTLFRADHSKNKTCEKVRQWLSEVPESARHQYVLVTDDGKVEAADPTQDPDEDEHDVDEGSKADVSRAQWMMLVALGLGFAIGAFLMWALH